MRSCLSLCTPWRHLCCILPHHLAPAPDLSAGLTPGLSAPCRFPRSSSGRGAGPHGRLLQSAPCSEEAAASLAAGPLTIYLTLALSWDSHGQLTRWLPLGLSGWTLRGAAGASRCPWESYCASKASSRGSHACSISNHTDRGGQGGRSPLFTSLWHWGACLRQGGVVVRLDPYLPVSLVCHHHR